MSDEHGGDDKVLCVPTHDPNWSDYTQLEDVPWQLRTEIEHFCSIDKQLEQNTVEVRGWHPRERALELIEASRVAYRRAAAS